MKEYIINSKKYGPVIILLDDSDYDRIIKLGIRLTLSKSNKHKDETYYVRFNLNGKKIYLHRWIMNCPQDKVVDHINHNPLDNRKCNLRIVTERENLMNKKNNTTSVAGVHYIKRNKTYRATIYINNKLIHLGQSKDINIAIKLRKEAEHKYLR